MKNKTKAITVLAAIIEAINEKPNKRANLDQIYDDVGQILKRDVNPATIRGIINRSLITRKSEGPFPILFERKERKTYALLKTKLKT